MHTQQDTVDRLLGDDERAFRSEVRNFIRANLDPETAHLVRTGRHMPEDRQIAWEKTLAKKGWSAPSWPKEYGGPGWNPVQKYLFNLEVGLNAAPVIRPFGLGMVGPVLYTFGTQKQKDYYLPKIVNADISWCQGFSEPGAGSDLAGFKTRAEDKGDHYLVNGQKIWTSKAHYADLMFALVRTDSGGRQQDGVTFLIIDMKAPGVTVRPIISIDLGHSLNEVFLENVVVTKENLIGEEGKGWSYAKFLLGHERSTMTSVAQSRLQLSQIKEIASRNTNGPRALLDDRGFMADLCELETELVALEFMELRMLAAEDQGGPAGPSLMKLKGTEVQQRMSRMMMRALGPDAVIYDDVVSGTKGGKAIETPSDLEGMLGEYLFRRAATIYGGSTEVQKNIVSKIHFRG